MDGSMTILGSVGCGHRYRVCGAADGEDGLHLVLRIAAGGTGQAIDNIPELTTELLVGSMDPLSAALNLTGIAGEEGEEEPDRPGWRSTSRSATLCTYQMQVETDLTQE